MPGMLGMWARRRAEGANFLNFFEKLQNFTDFF
jgi:hypothetical protein